MLGRAEEHNCLRTRRRSGAASSSYVTGFRLVWLLPSPNPPPCLNLRPFSNPTLPLILTLTLTLTRMTVEACCKQVRLMQPMAAGVRRSLHGSGATPGASAHWPRDGPLTALIPEDGTPPLERREFGTDGLRESMLDGGETPAEVSACKASASG